MSSAIERIHPVPDLETNSEERTFAPPQREGRADQEITSVACEALWVYHGLREFSNVYSNDSLPKELIDNRHENTPRYERMQQGVNSLKGRVAKLAEADPRIQTLFDLMVKTVVKEDEENRGLREIEAMVHELIGNEKIIPSHPFLKHGVVCLKDDSPLDIKPENLITETDLNKMIELKEHLLHPEKGLVKIDGDESFITDTFNDFEKLLTFPEGRELASNLINFDRELVITRGKIDSYTCATNSIKLTKNHNLSYGHSTSGLTRIKLPPYITLAHEVIHSLHSLAGCFKNNRWPKNSHLWTNQEEKDTIGHHKKIFGLTENAFIRHTFHLQRKYHNIPPALEPSQYSLDELIEECKLLENNDTLIDFIRTNELTKRQIDRIYYYYFWSSKVAHEILNTPMGKEFFKESVCFTPIFQLAAAENDISLVKRLFSEYPAQSKTIDPQIKAILVLNSLNENLDLAKLFVKNKFHLKAESGLEEILKGINCFGKEYISEANKARLQAVIRNRKLVKISDNFLRKLRRNPSIPPVIRQLLTS